MDIVLRAVAVFAFLLVLTRVIGRRELSSLQPLDLILLIILGDAVQERLTQDDYSLTGSFLAVGTIAVLQVFVSWVGTASRAHGPCSTRADRRSSGRAS